MNKVYTLVCYRPSTPSNDSLYSWTASVDTNILVKAWADVMVEDALRDDDVPLYEVDLFINGTPALWTGPIDNDHKPEDGPDPLDETPFKAEVQQLLLQAGNEMEHILAKIRNEEWMAAQQAAVDLGLLPPTNGPGRRN